MQLQQVVLLGLITTTYGLAVPRLHMINVPALTLNVSTPTGTLKDIPNPALLRSDTAQPIGLSPTITGSPAPATGQAIGNGNKGADNFHHKREDDDQEASDLSLSTIDEQTATSSTESSSSTSSKSSRPTVVIPPLVGTSRGSGPDGKENSKPADKPDGPSPAEPPVDAPLEIPGIGVTPIDLPGAQSKPDTDEKEDKKEQERQRKDEQRKGKNEAAEKEKEEKKKQKEQERQRQKEEQQRKKEALDKAVDEHLKQKEQVKQSKLEQEAKEKEETLKKTWEDNVRRAEKLYRADDISSRTYKQVIMESRRLTGFPKVKPVLTAEEQLVDAHKKALEAQERVRAAAQELAKAEMDTVATEQNKKLRQKKKEELQKKQRQRETNDQWCEAEPAPEIRSALKKGDTPWEPCRSGKFIKFDANAKAEDAQTKYNPPRINGKQKGGLKKGGKRSDIGSTPIAPMDISALFIEVVGIIGTWLCAVPTVHTLVRSQFYERNKHSDNLQSQGHVSGTSQPGPIPFHVQEQIRLAKEQVDIGREVLEELRDRRTDNAQAVIRRAILDELRGLRADNKPRSGSQAGDQTSAQQDETHDSMPTGVTIATHGNHHCATREGSGSP
nr:reticulocyte-binding protein 2 like a [Quercus suber]